MAHHAHETGTIRGAMPAPALPMQEDTMDTMTMNGDDVRHELQDLEKAQVVHAATQLGAQATQAATQAGGMATMAAAQAGTAAAVAAGGIGLVVGMFLGLAMVHTTRTHASSLKGLGAPYAAVPPGDPLFPLCALATTGRRA